MALEVYEQQESRSLSYSNGRLTGTRRFRVFDNSDIILLPGEVERRFGTNGLPQLDDVMFEDDSNSLTGAGSVVCKSYSIRYVSESRGVWEIEYTYEQADIGSRQPLDIGYSQFAFEFASEMRLKYRTNPGLTFPSLGDSTNGPGSPCGGRKIDVSGEPMSALHMFTTLTITETVAAETLVNRSSIIRTTRGKRNSGAFYGAPAGQVLYLGANASRIALDKYSIVHRFSHDSEFHMIQTPPRGPSGQVLDVRTDPDEVDRAHTVYWVQPFPDKADFDFLSENF